MHAAPDAAKKFDCCVCLHAYRVWLVYCVQTKHCAFLISERKLKCLLRVFVSLLELVLSSCITLFFVFFFCAIHILQVHTADGNHMSVPLLPLLLCEGVYFHAISQQALLSLTHIDLSLKRK